ncbi:uncharacterized protein E0L32_007522 [Thyridium curvatum]|uniref:Uncharacterized protein n=1 Tax=Thyridium curvatum TaxID=1093900 RepID=A0A507AM94_9PEZI|nr:uncharacterized protein E0L32_007522 [Thyridium curvatum]TPX11785.1 hypothetical protein E0L32_007522 [Thyridium curvatum]
MRSLLALAAAAPLLCAAAAAVVPGLPLDPRDVTSPDTPWISIDASGAAHTVTPSVSRDSSGGAPSTVSGPPPQLTSTAAYTLTVSGTPTTVTGQAPAVSATGAAPGSPEGVFFTCDKYVGQDKPFCLPQRGAALYPGRTYYITWYTAYFANPRTVMDIDITYGNGQGVTFPNLAASQGYFAWTVDADILSKQGLSQLSNVTIGLSYFETPGDNASDVLLPGPSVFIVPAPSPPSSGPGTAAIVVIVVVVVAALLVAALLAWSWRARGHPFALCMGRGLRRRSMGGGVRGSGQGYGVRKSHAERTAGVAAAAPDPDPDSKARGVELTDRESWSPTQGGGGGGRNVFREEVQRQENER